MTNKGNQNKLMLPTSFQKSGKIAISSCFDLIILTQHCHNCLLMFAPAVMSDVIVVECAQDRNFLICFMIKRHISHPASHRPFHSVGCASEKELAKVRLDELPFPKIYVQITVLRKAFLQHSAYMHHILALRDGEFAFYDRAQARFLSSIQRLHGAVICCFGFIRMMDARKRTPCFQNIPMRAVFSQT